MSRTRTVSAAALLALLGAGAAGATSAAPAARAAAVAPSASAAPSSSLPPGMMPLVHGRGAGVRAPVAAAPAGGPHLAYFGGRVISAISVVQVLYDSALAPPPAFEAAVSNANMTPSVAGFYRGITNSPYLDWMSEYSTTGSPGGIAGTDQTIGRGVFARQVTITPSAANDPFNNNPSRTIDDSQIQQELTAQIAANNLPGPMKDASNNIRTLYAIYFPRNVTITSQGRTSGVDFCAYHGTTTMSAPSREIYYSVLPDFSTGGMATQCGSGTEFQNVTAVSSHELAEAITDPEVGLASNFAAPLAWYDQPNNAESADICNGSDATVTGGDGVTYTVQRIWSNAQAACVDAPAPPHFSPQGVAALQVVTSNGTQLVFWQGAVGHLVEAWYDSGGWHGPVDWTAALGWNAPLASAPAVAVATDGTQVIFWEGARGHLIEAWWHGSWNGPVDWTATNNWSSSLGSAPAVSFAPDGTQLVFWRGASSHLVEAWWHGSWNGPVDWTAAYHWSLTLASAPNVAISGNGTQVIFWRGSGGHLDEAWWNGSWNGPVDWSAARGWQATLSSAPSVTFEPDGSQLIFWEGSGGHLDEAWWNGTWNGPVDWTAANRWGTLLVSAPSVAIVAADGTQVVFWGGAGGHLIEAWWQGSWNGPVDWSG